MSEPGFYKLVARSRKPAAKRFDRWVRHEVLPSIRQKGSYGRHAVEQCQDPASFHHLLSNYEDRLERLEGKIEADQPKVAFYETYADTDGLYGLQQAARVLEQGPRKFIKWLKQKRFLFQEGGVPVPYIRYINQGLFEVKAAIGNGRACTRTLITPKGVQYFARKLAGEKFQDLVDLQANLPGIAD